MRFIAGRTLRTLGTMGLVMLAGAAPASAISTWQSLHWTGANEQSTSVDRTSTGYVAVGDTDLIQPAGSRSIMLVQTDVNGNRLGTVHYYKDFFGGQGVTAQTIRVCSDGHFIIAGEIGANPLNRGILLMKVHSVTKNVIWSHVYAGTGFSGFTGSAVRERSGKKGFVITGRRTNAVGGLEGIVIVTDFNGNQVSGCSVRDTRYAASPQAQLSLHDVRENPDGSFTIVGWTRRSAQLPRELLCLRTIGPSACTGFAWARTYFLGQANADLPGESLDLAPAGAGIGGGYVFTGPWTAASGLTGSFVLRTQANGAPVWQFTNASLQDAQSIRSTFAGDYIVCGTSAGTQGSLMRVNAAGGIAWQRNFTSTAFPAGLERGTEALPTPDGGFAVTAAATNYFNPSAEFWLSKANAVGSSPSGCDTQVNPPAFPDQGFREIPLVTTQLELDSIIDMNHLQNNIEENDVCAEVHGCTTRPAGMTLWLPFDEAAGPGAANTATPSRPGVRVNGPLTVGGQYVGNGLILDGVNDYVDVATSPSYPGIDPGTGSFSIDAWVRKTTLDNTVQIIADHRLESGTVVGYSFFLGAGNTMGLQLADGGFTNWGGGPATAVPADGQWHLVAVVVNRGPSTTNTAQFYLDGAPVGPVINVAGRPGSLNPPAGTPFRVSSRSSSISGMFRGSIDEVEFFRRALTATEVNNIFQARSAGKCKDVAIASSPWICSPTATSVTTTVQVCNYSSNPQTYNYNFAPLGVGPGCTVLGPATYTPGSGTVTVAPGTCVPITVNMSRPAGLTAAGLTGCYQFFVTNTATGESTSATGSVIDARTWCFPLPPSPTTLHVAQTLPFILPVVNQQSHTASVTCRLRVIGPDMEPDTVSISLNGLPPGEPVLRTLSDVAPGGVQDLNVFLELVNEDPTGHWTLVIDADTDGDGEWEPLATYDLAQGEDAPACDPDMNQDGASDQGDVDYLINVIAGGDNPNNVDADFNRDGNIDQADVDALIDVIAGAPCP